MTTVTDVFITVLSYVACALTYMLIFIPIYGAARYLYLRKNGKTSVIDAKYEILLFAFVMYCIGLASLTVLPGVGGVENYRIEFLADEIIFVPFTVLRHTFANLTKGYYGLFFINFLGNIIVFVPLGFFISKIFRISLWKTALIGLCISLFIEVSQLFIAGRRSDIDDLWLNSFGALIGGAIAEVVKKRGKTQVSKIRQKKGQTDKWTT